MRNKSYFNWSGGKDSALSLYHALQDQEYSIERLLTSINSSFGRISMHGVRESLLEEQAKSIGIPLQKILLSEQPGMEEYEGKMEQTVDELKEEGFTHSFFGDIFLEDLRKYREEKLSAKGIKCEFPIWKRNTTELIHEFLDLGFKTIIVCIKADLLDQSLAGRIIDKDFLKDLPAGVDPCGENGEFHSFVFDGPIFKYPIPFKIGERVYKEYKSPNANESDSSSMGFWFCDLLEEENMNLNSGVPARQHQHI